MQKPKIGIPDLVHSNAYYTVHRVTVDFGDFAKEYFVSSDGRRAGVVIANEGSVLLVRQYRLLIDDFSLEIPGCVVHGADDPIEVVTEECVEETGLRCRDLKPLIGFEAALDTRDNPTQLYYCHRFEPVCESDRKRPQRQTVAQLWVRLDECVRMIFDGGIRDSVSIIGLLAYRTKLGES